MDVAQKHTRQTRINEDHYLCCKSVSGQRVRYNPRSWRVSVLVNKASLQYFRVQVGFLKQGFLLCAN